MARAIVGVANLTTSTQGVAKIEEFKSRASALAEEELQDAFYRPVAAPKLRPEPAPRYKPQEPEDTQEEDAFLRTRSRVPVRKGWLPRTRLGQFALAGGVLVGLAAIAAAAIAARELLKQDPRFRIDSSDSIQIIGNSQVTRAELLSVFGSDIGRNAFFVPLSERRAGLESLPWVEHATVMRLLPNQMRVGIVERTPIAFVRTGNEIALVDGNGVILPMPAVASTQPASPQATAMQYSFPVVTGIDADAPLSTRAARMHIYSKFIDALDASGEKISAQLSEVDLSDPEDVKAVVEAPGSDLLLHFGDEDFLARFRNYESHLAEWRQQYPHLASIDLRYERQVVLEMAKGASGLATASVAAQAPSSPVAADTEASAPAATSGTPKQLRDRSASPRKTYAVARRQHKPVRPAKAWAKRPQYSDSSPTATTQPVSKFKPYIDARPVAAEKEPIP